jgi:hypothetical protein
MRHIQGIANASVFLILFSISPVRAEKIVGLGISESSAGTEFNLSIASANARQFIIEQTTQSVFEYKKKNHGYEVNKTLQGSAENIKNKEVIHLRKKGVAVIVQADAQLPSYPDEICHDSKYKIKSASDLSKMIPGMLKKTVLDVAKTKLPHKSAFTGSAYIKNLDITKWRTKGRYTIRASICLANIH